MHVVHFNVREGLKEKRKIMERAEINVTENCCLSETLNIHSCKRKHTRKHTHYLSSPILSVPDHMASFHLSFSIHHTTHLLSLSLLLAAVNLLLFAPSSLTISVKNSVVLHRIFFTIWVNYPFNVFLYPAWNGIFITDNMWCALDQNGAVGLCHVLFFLMPLDQTRPGIPN